MMKRRKKNRHKIWEKVDAYVLLSSLSFSGRFSWTVQFSVPIGALEVCFRSGGQRIALACKFGPWIWVFGSNM